MSRNELEEYKAVADMLISMMREALDELDGYCVFFRNLKEAIEKDNEESILERLR